MPSTQTSTLISLTLGILFFATLPTLISWLVDPCQIFHKPYHGFFYHGFSGDSRCQNAGFINTYLKDPIEKFDSVLMGSSLSGNFKLDRIAKKNNLTNTIPLGMSGPRPIEQQFTIERAISTGSIRHIFWEVFPFQFFLFPNDSIQTIAKRNEFPLYLYNNSILDDYQYLFNKDTLRAVTDVLQKKDYFNQPNIIVNYAYWEHACTTEKTCQPYYNQAQIEDLRREYASPNFNGRTDADITNIDFSAVDRHLLSIVLRHCNQNIDFDLFFPPLSWLWYAKQDQAKFDYQLYMLRYVINKTQQCKNIRVFAFNNEKWISGDLAHYHDPRHFYGGVHDYIIDSMATRKHLITLDNIGQFEREFIENVNNYVPWASTAEELSHSPH